MIRYACVAALALGFSAFQPLVASAQIPDPIRVTLQSPPSEFEWGCFGPCACAVLVQSPMTGAMTLLPSGPGPLYTTYDVLDVQWKTGGATPTTITGSGVYRRGGEVTDMEQLTLDLSFDGGPLQHFDSGLEPVEAPFPGIDVHLSLHGETCHDSVLVVDTISPDVTGVGNPAAAGGLVAGPNPFHGATEIHFTLARDGAARLRVLDLGGRRVRTLVDGWLGRGAHESAWDGRNDAGTPVPAGLYFIRLDGPGGRSTHIVVKLR